MEPQGGMEEKRRRMKPISDTMRGGAAALALEVEAWPGVTLKSAFGMTLAYRTGIVFAALPRTRALYQEDAILLKFMHEKPGLAARMAAEKRFAGSMEERHNSTKRAAGEGRRWRIFLIREDADVHAAIEWLAEAFKAARAKSK